ncbi:putative nuclease [Synechococcus sp. PROS-9-1]|uniref:thermonuclease family protein n=1 Tax=Synechococcus sp. PROS-9-1 TaxID=1968775 RepID=UPI00164420A4|nr:thermonuclease family protein [Synechococcus sp. PROS-9-1]QNJ32761.1 putative nuclease [Synechococcus sp. PROS-9-1]
MKAASAFLLTFCFATSANSATIVSVGDGDTVRVSEGSRRITIRLACIDSPETSQRPWGARSKTLLKQLTPVGSEVTLQVQTTDRFGRTVAELLNSQGNVNQQMVGAGQAFAYRKYLRECDAQKYLQLEEEAKRQGIGVWSVGPAGITRPWDYRRERRSSSTSTNKPRKYRCKEIGSWSRAQQLLSQGHSYLDGDGDGEACESLK